MLFYTHTNCISFKSHSHICGWKTQSIALEILVRPQRARGTAKQPCCSDITHLTSSALLLRYPDRSKKSLWAEVALEPIIKIAKPVALLSHFQKNKITLSLLKIQIKTMICDCSWVPDPSWIEEGQLDQDVPETQLTWSDLHHFHLADGLRQLCTCLRANSGLESHLELPQSREAFSEEGCSQLEQV